MSETDGDRIPPADNSKIDFSLVDPKKPLVREYSTRLDSTRLDSTRLDSTDRRDRAEYIPKAATPSEQRILGLGARLDASQRPSIYGDLKKLGEANENPRAANRDWLINVYAKKGWIDTEKADVLRTADVATSLAELETLCLEKAVLRTDVELPEIPLPPHGTALGPYMREQIEELGYEPAKCKVRFLLDASHLQRAIQTGNDRDYNARIDYHGGYDGEELAMIRAGISRPTRTTYLANLATWETTPHTQKQDYGVLVYAPDAVEPIGPSGYPLSNGFHAFHFGGDVMQRSLLAVFASEETLREAHTQTADKTISGGLHLTRPDNDSKKSY